MGVHGVGVELHSKVGIQSKWRESYIQRTGFLPRECGFVAKTSIEAEGDVSTSERDGLRRSREIENKKNVISENKFHKTN